MILNWASMWNCGNQGFDVKGEIQVGETMRMRVPKQSIRADQLVVCAGQCIVQES